MTKVSDVGERGLIGKVLSRPDLFPEQFLSWLRNFIASNRFGVPTTTAVSTGAVKGITANWGDLLPTAAGSFTGTTLRVPERAGASANFTATKAYLRLETAATGAVTLLIEKMTPDADSTWATAATLATLTLAAGHFETTATISQAVTTGDLLRIRFTALAATGLFHVEVTGT